MCVAWSRVSECMKCMKCVKSRVWNRLFVRLWARHGIKNQLESMQLEFLVATGKDSCSELKPLRYFWCLELCRQFELMCLRLS